MSIGTLKGKDRLPKMGEKVYMYGNWVREDLRFVNQEGNSDECQLKIPTSASSTLDVSNGKLQGIDRGK